MFPAIVDHSWIAFKMGFPMDTTLVAVFEFVVKHWFPPYATRFGRWFCWVVRTEALVGRMLETRRHHHQIPLQKLVLPMRLCGGLSACCTRARLCLFDRWSVTLYSRAPRQL